MVWEGGDNRVLKLPKSASFEIICHWNMTNEAVNLLSVDGREYEVEVESVGETQDDNGSVNLEGATSPFVEKWKGKEASFVQSNDHGNREKERHWDTSGLEGVGFESQISAAVTGDNCVLFGFTSLPSDPPMQKAEQDGKCGVDVGLVLTKQEAEKKSHAAGLNDGNKVTQTVITTPTSMTMTNIKAANSEATSQKEEKFEIDLMRTSPERKGTFFSFFVVEVTIWAGRVSWFGLRVKSGNFKC